MTHKSANRAYGSKQWGRARKAKGLAARKAEERRWVARSGPVRIVRPKRSEGGDDSG